MTELTDWDSSGLSSLPGLGAVICWDLQSLLLKPDALDNKAKDHRVSFLLCFDSVSPANAK